MLKRSYDAGVIRLIQKYSNSGNGDHRVVIKRHLATTPGEPLSSQLAKVMLEDVDEELERRGHCFARYVVDCNVYVYSRRAGERVIALLRRLYSRLHLTINKTKRAVASVFANRQFPWLQFLGS